MYDLSEEWEGVPCTLDTYHWLAQTEEDTDPVDEGGYDWPPSCYFDYLCRGGRMDRKHAEVLTYHHWSQSRWARQAMDRAEELQSKNYELEWQARAANALQVVMRNMREGNYND